MSVFSLYFARSYISLDFPSFWSVLSSFVVMISSHPEVSVPLLQGCTVAAQCPNAQDWALSLRKTWIHLSKINTNQVFLMKNKILDGVHSEVESEVSVAHIRTRKIMKKEGEADGEMPMRRFMLL